MRELTESRNKLASFRAIQAERMADLQHEYMRVMRVADLSRAVSKENLGKTAQATQRLNQVRASLGLSTAPCVHSLAVDDGSCRSLTEPP